jgi:hypothetical protein
MNPIETKSTEPTSADYYRATWAEWDELVAKYPAPTLDEVRAEWLWIREHAADGTIDPEGKYWGLHIAVYQQKVVGAGPGPIVLQIRLARELGIHPERTVVVYRGEI